MIPPVGKQKMIGEIINEEKPTESKMRKKEEEKKKSYVEALKSGKSMIQ